MEDITTILKKSTISSYLFIFINMYVLYKEYL